MTQVITSFNASAAGFTFESFLAVLLGGSQIATGAGTIADFRTGQGEPVSLKLYKKIYSRVVVFHLINGIQLLEEMDNLIKVESFLEHG